MKVFTAHSDGKVLIPDEPVELHQETAYRVRPVPAAARGGKGRNSLRELLLEFAGTMKGDYPADLAENHDHYLHGRPKKEWHKGTSRTRST